MIMMQEATVLASPIEVTAVIEAIMENSVRSFLFFFLFLQTAKIFQEKMYSVASKTVVSKLL